jgi:hypothetical protein
MKIIAILSIGIFSMAIIGSVGVIIDDSRATEHFAAFAAFGFSVSGIIWALIGQPTDKDKEL